MGATSKNPRNLLLHACCGPCSLEPSRLLAQEGFDLAIYYANSNIEPAAEYARRLDTIGSWAAQAGIPFVEGPYDPRAWEATAGRIGDAALAEAREKAGRDAADAPSRADGDIDLAPLAIDPAKREARCRACYRLRFEEAARVAAERGFDALCTTLSVSPYQYTDVIREELSRACAQAGVEAIFRDFRPNYAEATRRSRELGMYRQNYCGCRLSDAEAAAERAVRKRERAAEKAARNAACADERAAAEAERAARRAERAAYDEKQRRKREVLRALREQEKASRSE